MSIARPKFRPVGWISAGLLTWVMTPAAAPGVSQFTSYSRDSRHVLEGNWQSCRDTTGRYAERVYDHVVNGAGRFEVHLGPRDEFAVFTGVQDEHRDHDSPDNLLKPYRVESQGGRAKRRWDLPALGLAFTVTLAGGSSGDCESWFVLLEPLTRPRTDRRPT